MKRKPLLIAALVLVAGLVALAGWLGPLNFLWSLKALTTSSSGPDWRHVPANPRVLVAADLRSLAESAAFVRVRPRLERLAASRGMTLNGLDGVNHVVATEDLAIASGVALSPALLPRVDSRWREMDVGGAPAVSDGNTALVPLSPGIVLATLASRVAAISLLVSEPSAVQVEPLPLGSGVLLAARVEPDDAMRLLLMRRAPAQATEIVRDVVRAVVLLSPADDVGTEIRIEMRDEAGATRLQGLLMQVDGGAKMAKSAGPIAAMLLGKATAEMLADVPPLEITREVAAVRVRGRLDAAALDRWLARAEAALGVTAPGP